jgi:hypothetical protein
MSPSVIGDVERVSSRLTLVGGWVFTRGIEHTFENSVIQMMQEVLL